MVILCFRPARFDSFLRHILNWPTTLRRQHPGGRWPDPAQCSSALRHHRYPHPGPQHPRRVREPSSALPLLPPYDMHGLQSDTDAVEHAAKAGAARSAPTASGRPATGGAAGSRRPHRRPRGQHHQRAAACCILLAQVQLLLGCHHSSSRTLLATCHNRRSGRQSIMLPRRLRCLACSMAAGEGEQSPACS